MLLIARSWERTRTKLGYVIIFVRDQTPNTMDLCAAFRHNVEDGPSHLPQVLRGYIIKGYLMGKLTSGGKCFGSFRKVSSGLGGFDFFVKDPGFTVVHIFATGLEVSAECLLGFHD